MHFKGQRVLVTGASSGIGRALANAFAAEGAALVITARSEDRLRELAAEINSKHGVDVRVVAADLEVPGGSATLAQAIEAQDLQIDHLVNNAGFGGAKAFHEMDPSSVAAMLRLNCEALTTLTRCYLPAMLGRQQGGVLMVASLVGLFPVPFMAEYAASKAYVISFGRALREEARGSGVRLSVLCPGAVPSGFQSRAGYTLTAAESNSSLPADQVARIAVRGYIKNRTLIVPGATNRIGAALVGFVPVGWMTRISGIVLKRLRRA